MKNIWNENFYMHQFSVVSSIKSLATSCSKYMLIIVHSKSNSHSVLFVPLLYTCWICLYSWTISSACSNKHKTHYLFIKDGKNSIKRFSKNGYKFILPLQKSNKYHKKLLCNKRCFFCSKSFNEQRINKTKHSIHPTYLNLLKECEMKWKMITVQNVLDSSQIRRNYSSHPRELIHKNKKY